MTHIVIVSTSFPDEAFENGQEAAGAFVYDFVVELANYVEVTAVVPSKQASISKLGNLTIHRFPVSSLPLSLLKPTNPMQWSRIWDTLKSGGTAVLQAVQSKPTDHIFALWVLPSGYWARKASQRFGIPYSTWALGSDIWGLGKVPLVRNVLRSVLRDSQVRFADGYQLAEDVTAICGMNCEFLPSSRKLLITTQKTLASAPPYKLAFLGRWHPNKGIDLLLESLQLLTDEDWQRIKEVRIFGGGPLEEEVRKGCDVLQGNGRSVTIGGYLNRQEATELLMWSDYLLLPSRIESIPVIFSDAMQTQCPIIATPIGDIPQLMTDYHVGILASETSATAIAQAIKLALNSTPNTFQEGIQSLTQIFNINQSAATFLRNVRTEQPIVETRP